MTFCAVPFHSRKGQSLPPNSERIESRSCFVKAVFPVRAAEKPKQHLIYRQASEEFGSQLQPLAPPEEPKSSPAVFPGAALRDTPLTAESPLCELADTFAGLILLRLRLSGGCGEGPASLLTTRLQTGLGQLPEERFHTTASWWYPHQQHGSAVTTAEWSGFESRTTLTPERRQSDLRSQRSSIIMNEKANGMPNPSWLDVWLKLITDERPWYEHLTERQSAAHADRMDNQDVA
ncbi:hypothetical protein MJT46_006398 [Ovis ammon polii x Ovis aries]|nr:hypothetical protein MJT46_006398 [Ovis ammon polii x Ovis aries]